MSAHVAIQRADTVLLQLSCQCVYPSCRCRHFGGIGVADAQLPLAYLLTISYLQHIDLVGGSLVIHLVTRANRALYSLQIEALHRARKEVFVDELGWNLPVRDGMEFDDYDDEHSATVIGFTADRDVAMSVRMRPTVDRSMLTDHFAHALPIDVRPINDGRTWEVSRGFCREIGRKRLNLRRKAACMLAPLEVALQNGIDRLVGFSDVRMLTFFVNIGWKITILGDAIPYGEGDGFAYDVEVSAVAVATMRAKWALPEPAYVYFVKMPSSLACPFECEKDILLRRPELATLAPDYQSLGRPTKIGGYFGASVGQFTACPAKL